MYENCNGHTKDSTQVEDIKSKSFQVGFDYNIHSSEPNFHGFEKIPKIVCQRVDITPYLSKNNLSATVDAPTMIPSVKDICLAKMTQECVVVLARDDLKKLRDMVRNKQYNGVSNLKCKICSKTYSSEKKLHNHLSNKHMLVYKPENKTIKRVSFSDHIIIHEVKEYHSCRKCPKIFENYEKLKLHMKQKHKKRRCYICFYCSKEFVDRTFFKIHIRLHCDACGLLLPNRKAYTEHRRLICKIIKKYECKTCHCSFYNYMDLKDHSYEHLGTFYICDVCKDQFQSKCEVGHHINFSHTENRLTELYNKQSIDSSNIYTCNFCEDTFQDEYTIKSHVSILPDLHDKVLTSYKDYIFCNQCFGKFSTETEMLQHKWSHYLKTSDNSQIRDEKTTNNKIKTVYRVDEKLPAFLQPKLVLEKVKVPEKKVKKRMQLLDKNNVDFNMELKKPVIDPVSKKTIISKHRCEICGKYLSTNYCLNRHMIKVHGNQNQTPSLQCPICEEIFVWPSLLASHRCIRMAIPEMPFDDARPEVHFDNMNENYQDFEGFNVPDEEYMGVDFEIPAPIVQLTEFDNLNIVINSCNGQLNVKNNDKTFPLSSVNYKVIMQEVPIEF